MQSQEAAKNCILCIDNEALANSKCGETLHTAKEKKYNSLCEQSRELQRAGLHERLKLTWESNAVVYYHNSCVTSLYNDARKATKRPSQSAELLSPRSAKRQCTKKHDNLIEKPHPVKNHLFWRNRCILCKELPTLYPRHPDIARAKYRIPDSVSADDLKDSFIETAKERADEWGISVLGSLEGMYDLVAEEALYHIKCRLHFETGRDMPTLDGVVS